MKEDQKSSFGDIRVTYRTIAHRGKKWFNTSVSSVLKRKHERDVLLVN
jgi:hypothetical protein